MRNVRPAASHLRADARRFPPAPPDLNRLPASAVMTGRVYPPEATASLYVADKDQACADPGTGRPRVSALSKSPDQPPG